MIETGLNKTNYHYFYHFKVKKSYKITLWKEQKKYFIATHVYSYQDLVFRKEATTEYKTVMD